MFKHLNDLELNLKIKSLAQVERKLTRVMIEHIAEVDRRKLYLKLNFDSLFRTSRKKLVIPTEVRKEELMLHVCF
ncbi:MAG: hypothetical protein K2X47_06585 [Bdellovibrionales bacterium]|nr:hypothetical protein [Bdellovibrionales bacterium]